MDAHECEGRAIARFGGSGQGQLGKITVRRVRKELGRTEMVVHKEVEGEHPPGRARMPRWRQETMATSDWRMGWRRRRWHKWSRRTLVTLVKSRKLQSGQGCYAKVERWLFDDAMGDSNKGPTMAAQSSANCLGESDEDEDLEEGLSF
ncbi:hypothetical protein ACSQ67_016518 [Phaseolus vulgaris]